jgi:uncharacterized protein DUF6519
VRRWDGPYSTLDGRLPGIVYSAAPGVVDLEDAIQVAFTYERIYLTGDYWQIPARSNTEAIEWPSDTKCALPQRPAGITHAYCPLAILDYDSGNNAWVVYAKRPTFGALVDFLDKRGDTMTGPLNISSGDSEQPALLIGQEFYTDPYGGADSPVFVASGNAVVYNPSQTQDSFIVLQAPDSEAASTHKSARLLLVDNFNRTKDDDPAASIEFFATTNQIDKNSVVQLTYSGTNVNPQGYTLNISSPWGKKQNPAKALTVYVDGNICATGTIYATGDIKPFTACNSTSAFSDPKELGEPEDLPSEAATKALMALDVSRQSVRSAPKQSRLYISAKEPPEAVAGDENIIALLVKVVQDQASTIDALSARIKAIEDRAS